jgi:sulfite exporter TauE/SafE
MASPAATGTSYLRLGGVVLALAALFFLLSRIDLIPDDISFGENISYGIVFLIGLLASVSTCIAVTGGLFMSLASKYDERAAHLSSFARFATYLSFNAGRIISYTVFGALIGLAGSALTLSPAAYGVITIVVSALMLVLGVQMLGLLPGSLRLQMPVAIRRWNETLIERRSRSAAFALGAMTFFLPCGFTQALQLYVLAKADPIAGALTMFVFSLGTLPVLMGLSLATSFSAGNFKRYFFRFAGAAVIVLSLSSIHQGLLLLDLWPSRFAATQQQAALKQSKLGGVTMQDGKQVANMKVIGLEYVPNRFAVAEGVPVEWRIDATEAEGCGRVIVVPKLRITRLMSATAPTVIQFTPSETGEISFNCGMRMMTPGSKFIVTPRAG